MRRCPAVTPSVEALENRLQFATSTPFAARINFTTAAGPRVAGYTKDYGAVYGHHTNGLTYGWNDDHRSQAFYAPSKQYNNALVDSNIAMSNGDSWSIAVPNGYYNVHALMGQPGVMTGDQRLTAEGDIFVNGQPYNGFAFIEGFITVPVLDGKLTLAPTNHAVADKLVSVEISQTTPPPVIPPGNNIAWSNSSIQAPSPRVEFSSVRIDRKIYLLGGFTDNYTSTTQRFEVFDIKTASFTQLANLPGAPTHEAVATDGTYIYSAGGQFGPERSTDLTDVVWRYDIANNRWQRFGRLPAIRTGGTLSYIYGKLHYIGGDDATRVRATNTHWVLDLSSTGAGWKDAAPLPGPADHAATVVLNRGIYFVGGDNLHGTSYLSQSGLYFYDPVRDKWATLASIPTGVSHAEAATFTDGKSIFVVAGQGNAQKLTSNVYVYTIRKNRWSAATPLPSARKGGFAWLSNGKLYYITGDDSVKGLDLGGYIGVITA